MAIEPLIAQLAQMPAGRIEGRVRSCTGTVVACAGLNGILGIGDLCRIGRNAHNPHVCGPMSTDEEPLLGEVVAFDDRDVLLMPYAEVTGVTRGAPVVVDHAFEIVAPDRSWLGRIVDPLCNPLDGGPLLPQGPIPYDLQARALPAYDRQPVGARIELGVPALDLFTPCCRGQRLGIFAGSGVGKSTLLSMIAANATADALVIGLVGERGRELNEFLHTTLSPEARARSVVVVATSDMPAMLRRRAAYLTMTIAERLRDEGMRVLCLMDSVTRVATALREIYLGAGEPPTTKGYPAAVFAELPRLLERAGPGRGDGSITGLFTVLVEGDDTTDPVADTVRSTLDGHIMLDRAIAESGRFPAIDVPRSISRTAPGCYDAQERDLAARARRLMRTHEEMRELIQLGAYVPGSDPLTDEAIARMPALERLLSQAPGDRRRADEAWDMLAEALGDTGAAS